jgi:hypothetical protein
MVNALITVEGQHSDAEADVASATEDLLDLLAEYQSAAVVSSALLSASQLHFKAEDSQEPSR